jgi:zinc transport system substrate-binding protein
MDQVSRQLTGATLLIAIVGSGAATACGRTAGSPRLGVETSVYPLQFFTQQISGDNADVETLTPPGFEPHDYEPTARDLVAIQRARLLILNGVGLEPWAQKVTRDLDPKRTQVAVVGEGLTTLYSTEKGERVADPHVWLSPPLAEHVVNRIDMALEQVDPDHATAYASNALTLAGRLRDLDIDYTRGLARCASRDVTTSHAAFGYLAAAYGLRQIPISGLTPEAEPSPKQLADIAALARTRHVRTVFFESLASPRLAQALATEIGANTMVLDPIEGKSREDLKAGNDYFTTMRQNLASLRAALQCAP